MYDVTIAYKNNCPSFSDNVFGVDPSEVHIHVRRISIEDIPATEAKSAAWLIATFELKDKMLSGFNDQGHFPDIVAQEELSLVQCLANFMLVILLTAVFIYLTFCSLPWFRIYICLSCVYLTMATHLDIRSMPFLGFVTTILCFKRKK